MLDQPAFELVVDALRQPSSSPLVRTGGLVKVVLLEQRHDPESPERFQLLLVQVWFHEEGVADLEAFP